MPLFDFGSGGASWLDDIEFSPSFAPAAPITVAAAPVVPQPVAPPPAVVMQAPAPVQQPRPVVTPPPVYQTLPIVEPTVAPIRQPTPMVTAPPPAPVEQAPTPLQILEQQQNIGMAPITAPAPVAMPVNQPAPARPIPQVQQPVLSPRDQALFNRNIPSTGPVRTPVAQTALPPPPPILGRAMTQEQSDFYLSSDYPQLTLAQAELFPGSPMPTNFASLNKPVAQAAPPPRAAQQSAAQNYATMYANQMNQYFPAPASTPAARPTTVMPPRPAVAARPTSQVIPYNMASLPQTVQPRMATGNQITMNKPMTVPADTYRGPVVTSQGRITPQQAQRIVR